MSTAIDAIAAVVETASRQHRQHISASHPDPGICVSRCPGPWPCAPARFLMAIQAIWVLVRDSEGGYLGRDCHVRVGEFQDALIDALIGPLTRVPEPAGTGSAPDYLAVFTEFWAPIVQRADGTLNFGQLARELADYHDLIGWVTEVYSSVTGGQISKPNTHPSAVIAVAEDYADELVGQAIDELISAIKEQGGGASSPAEIVSLIRELTGRHPAGASADAGNAPRR